MKYFFLSVLFAAFFTSCTLPSGEKSSIVIIEIAPTDDNFISRYYINNSVTRSGIDLHFFNDSVGKFKVGDRLHFEK